MHPAEVRVHVSEVRNMQHTHVISCFSLLTSLQHELLVCMFKTIDTASNPRFKRLSFPRTSHGFREMFSVSPLTLPSAAKETNLYSNHWLFIICCGARFQDSLSTMYFTHCSQVNGFPLWPESLLQQHCTDLCFAHLQIVPGYPQHGEHHTVSIPVVRNSVQGWQVRIVTRHVNIVSLSADHSAESRVMRLIHSRDAAQVGRSSVQMPRSPVQGSCPTPCRKTVKCQGQHTDFCELALHFCTTFM